MATRTSTLRAVLRFFCLSIVVFVICFMPTAVAVADKYDAMCTRAFDCAYYDPNACSSTDVSTSGGPISGDTRTLAQQILDNPKISFDYGPSGDVARNFKLLADNRKAKTDAGNEVEVQPIILVTILHIAQSHKVNISSLTDGSSHTAPTNPHGSGKAVDINILDGAHTNGSDSVANTIINSAAEVLPAGARFGMGNGPFGTKEISGKTFSSFTDNATHVHADVMGVAQTDIDKAVEAAGGAAGSTTTNEPSSSCCSTSSDSSLSGTTEAEKAFRYFVGPPASLSPEAAAGIVGNMMKESGGNTEKLLTHAHNDISGTHDGIVQWSTGRWAALKQHEKGDPYKLSTQLDYVWYELSEGGYKSVLTELKGASSAEQAATIFNAKYEVSGDGSGDREFNARKIFAKYKDSAPGAGGETQGTSEGCEPVSDDTNTDMKKTITVSTPGRFITLPSKYSCPGRTTRIDSRIAADIAYLVDHFNMCADDGLASGHKSHGAGVAVDMVPKNGNSKDDWKKSTEAAARAMGWYGDSADEPKSSKGCAQYTPGDYGHCMHESEPKIPTWVRWIGYNGDFQHGDPWHIYGGAFPHIHISWDTPSHDGASPTAIDKPRDSVYAFPAPVPDDLKKLIN